MSQLASAIEKAADAFAKEIIAAVKAATLQELLAMQGGVESAPTPKRGRPAKVEAPARRRGRPSKAKPGRKPGRPAKVKDKKVAKKAPKVRARKKTKIKWPKCKHRGCKRNAWARGKGFCGEHFKASKAGKK